MSNYINKIFSNNSDLPYTDTEKIKENFYIIMSKYERYKDKHFDQEINLNKNKFHQRLFEAYMGYILNKSNIYFTSSEEGPDFYLKDIETYIECIAPENCKGKNRINREISKASDIKMKVNIVPEEKIMLRLTSALSGKIEKFRKYKKNKIIKEGSYIIAINGALLPYYYVEDNIPRIVKALYGVGHEVIDINSNANNFLSKREQIKKNKKIKIEANYFRINDYSDISAVIYSRMKIESLDKIEDEIIIINNPFSDRSIEPLKELIDYSRFYNFKEGRIIIKKS